MNVTSLDDEQLKERHALLLTMLENSGKTEPATSPRVPGSPAETHQQAEVPEHQPVLDLCDDDVVETVYLENRISMATHFPEITTAFVLKTDLPEYQRIMQEYQEAVAQTISADTLSLEYVMKADEVRRSLSVFNKKLQDADVEVANARQQLEAAQRRLATVENRAAAIRDEHQAAQINVIETIRQSEEAIARADIATFTSIKLANMANRYLLDQEINAAETASALAARRAEGLRGNFSTIEEMEKLKNRLKVPFAFKASTPREEETECSR